MTTSEDGSKATFTVKLNTIPGGIVVIDVDSLDKTEVTVDLASPNEPLQLTFTDANWATPQTVTVTGVDDAIADGNQTVTVTLDINRDLTAPRVDYNAINPPDISVINSDNETVGVTVAPTSVPNWTTSEAGSTATFSVVLNTAPDGDVVIDVASSDPTEGTISPSQLTFTPADWAIAQTVTVTGVDDSIADGNQTYDVALDINITLTTDTTGYDAIDPTDVSVINSDNDAPAVTVAPTSIPNWTTTEAAGAGQTATFSLILNTAPDGNVVIDVASSDLTEGTVSPAQLSFTPTNWATAQTVTVTGVDDDIADGNQIYDVTLDINTTLTTDNTGYALLNLADVSMTNTDNDAPGVTVAPTSVPNWATTEAGDTATFSVVLNTAPDGDVVIDVASSDLTEGTVSPAQLTFTPADWFTAQPVTVTGVDDEIADGNQTFAVTVNINTTSTADNTGYASLDLADVSVTNSDNDIPGATVTPTSLTTNEAAGAGHTATFTVVLNTIPDGNVVINVASSDTSEITLAPIQLIFDADNWSTAQTVTVTGVDDFVADGNQLVNVSLSTHDGLTTDTTGYDAVDPADVAVTNIDNGTPGVTVTPITLTTTEAAGAGHTATFTVVLNTVPVGGNVVIDVASSDTSEITVAPATLTFDDQNSSTPQTVTVTGVDDGITDGNQNVTVVLTMNAVATDATGYDPVNPADVAVTNIDDDIAGVTVTPTTLTTNEAPGSGHTATFTVVLNTIPDGIVEIGVASSDLSEITVAPATLTFDAGNWSTAQTVTVTGVDDFIADTNQGVSVLLTTNDGPTTATGYDAVDPTDVAVTNIDNGAPGVTVTPISLTTTEAAGAGHTATFTVVLNTVPDGNVVIDVASSDTSEITVAPATLTFDATNWSTLQTVTVTGADDGNFTDGNQNVSVLLTTNAAATDATGYDAVDPTDVAVTNIDNDIAGVTPTPTSLTTTEAPGSGHTATFTVVLNTIPDGIVEIGVASSDLSEITVSPATLTFDAVNWSTTQTVTVTGVDDFIADTNQGVSVLLTTNDGPTTATGYDAVDPTDVAVTNIDNGAPGVTVTPISLTTTEAVGAGHTATFTVVLNTVPDGIVEIGVSVPNSDTGEITVDKAALTFDATNWSTLQTVTVTGVDDFSADGNQAVSVVLETNNGPTTATNYDAVDPTDVAVTNIDNGAPGVTATPISLNINELATDTFTVRLNTIPAGDVVIDVASSNTDELTVAPTTLTFNATNWSTPQTVTVAGIVDVIGNTPYTVGLTMNGGTTAAGYGSLNPDDVSVTIIDLTPP